MRLQLFAPLIFAVVSASCGMDDVLIDIDNSPVSTMGPETYRYGATTDGALWIWEVSFASKSNGCISATTCDARKWIYLVTFERQYEFEGQRFVGRGTLRIPVRLDGRVIAGKKA